MFRRSGPHTTTEAGGSEDADVCGVHRMWPNFRRFPVGLSFRSLGEAFGESKRLAKLFLRRFLKAARRFLRPFAKRFLERVVPRLSAGGVPYQNFVIRWNAT
jgi:hypothetical protein